MDNILRCISYIDVKYNRWTAPIVKESGTRVGKLSNIAKEGQSPQMFVISCNKIDKFDNLHSTRSCAALRAADLDWIVGPEYSLGGYIFGDSQLLRRRSL